MDARSRLLEAFCGRKGAHVDEKTPHAAARGRLDAGRAWIAARADVADAADVQLAELPWTHSSSQGAGDGQVSAFSRVFARPAYARRLTPSPLRAAPLHPPTDKTFSGCEAECGGDTGRSMEEGQGVGT